MSSIHASALLINEKVLIIRGDSGSGKSRLCLRLLQEKRYFTRLIGDDRLFLEAINNKILVSPAIAGLLEVRGQGIISYPNESIGVVGALIDLVDEGERLPNKRVLNILGVELPHFILKKSDDPLPLVISLLDANLF